MKPVNRGDGVYVCDLPEDFDLAPMTSRGFGRPTRPSHNELFWNGKPMYVRVSQLVGHHDVQLQILPLGRDYPIYLQEEQRAQLEAASDGVLLNLDGIAILHRNTLVIE